MDFRLIARAFLIAVFISLMNPSSFALAQPPAAMAAAPRIERFDLDPPTRLMPGEALIFRITGSSRCNASVSIVGVKNKIALREVMAGIYEGAYTIKNDDRMDINSIVTGNLRLGNQDIAAVLGQPLVDISAVAAFR